MFFDITTHTQKHLFSEFQGAAIWAVLAWNYKKLCFSVSVEKHNWEIDENLFAWTN